MDGTMWAARTAMLIGRDAIQARLWAAAYGACRACAELSGLALSSKQAEAPAAAHAPAALRALVTSLCAAAHALLCLYPTLCRTRRGVVQTPTEAAAGWHAESFESTKVRGRRLWHWVSCRQEALLWRVLYTRCRRAVPEAEGLVSRGAPCLTYCHGEVQGAPTLSSTRDWN